MNERPILFTPENAQKVLLGTKTQTRRVVKPQPKVVHGWNLQTNQIFRDGRCGLRCPYGVEGDRLWVRETFRSFPDGDTFYKGDFGEVIPVHADDDPNKWKWQPCLHMPRKLCRTIVELTAVRVERLQEISKDDVIAEGCTKRNGEPLVDVVAGWHEPYAALWESINGAGSWALNPWVWVLEFKRLEGMR